MSIYLARNGKMLTRLNGTRYFGDNSSPVPPVPTFDEVTIGSQTWMSKNLAVDDGGEGIYSQTVNYGQGDVVEYYYTWDAAVRVAASIEGWHLPSDSEWREFGAGAGGFSKAGTKLKSSYGWYEDGNGTDDYGFSAFPGGVAYDDGGFSYFGRKANFWTATQYSDDAGYMFYFDIFRSMSKDYYLKTYGYSVRLIKDS